MCRRCGMLAQCLANQTCNWEVVVLAVPLHKLFACVPLSPSSNYVLTKAGIHAIWCNGPVSIFLKLLLEIMPLYFLGKKLTLTWQVQKLLGHGTKEKQSVSHVIVQIVIESVSRIARTVPSWMSFWTTPEMPKNGLLLTNCSRLRLQQ